MVACWGMSPADFWGMSPQEFWLLYDEHKPTEMVGKLTRSEFDELRSMLNEPPTRSN